MYAVLKFDPAQPRDEKGRWAKVGERVAHLKATYPAVAKHYPRSTHTEMGSIESHTKDVGREWERQLSHEELAGISERFGSDVETLMASAIALHDIGKAEAIEEGAGKEHQHEHTVPIMQTVLREEGFSEQEVALATELLNHDLIGPLFRGWSDETDVSVAAKLTAKAQRVGMDVSDFATLQLAFYQADAAAYPYITQYMTQEPSGRWTFKGRKQIAAIEALARKREYVREPAGSSEGGQFAKTTGGIDPKKKETWYRKGGDWNTDPITGGRPYGWKDTPENYEVPPLHHKVLRMKDVAVWGYSHSGSSMITGESAKQMGIEGYREMDPQQGVISVATRMLEEIATDATGAEEPLYHSFENVEGTTFRPGDTMDLPLTATAGQPETGYATRSEHESQEGVPTVLVFPKGTKMVAYGMWPTNPKQRGYEDGNAKEFGHVYSEAIVAGRFRVVKVETVYMGSQHSRKPVAPGDIPQLYGQVVHLEPIGYFNPSTGKWEDHG